MGFNTLYVFWGHDSSKGCTFLLFKSSCNHVDTVQNFMEQFWFHDTVLTNPSPVRALGQYPNMCAEK